MHHTIWAAGAASLALALPAFAAHEPAGTELPVAKDVQYPGTLSLDVDLRDVEQRVFQVHEVIPVHAGPLVLLYPKWIPGEHGPTGTLDALAGVRIFADGQSLPWRRDLKEMYALHLNVPAGVHQLELRFQMLSHPHLERIEGTPDRLTPITQPHWPAS